MNTEEIMDATLWAQQTFGACRLGDRRRGQRAVQAAAHMAANPSASLPAQQGSWGEVMALYRLLAQSDVTFEALIESHWQHTRELLETQPVVLLVQDGTELDLSSHHKMTGLGPIGQGTTRGLLLQTVLAVLPETREVLGCASQEVFVRQPIPVGETRSKRRERAQRETDVWMRLVSRLGRFPAETLAVHVGDRGADFFGFFEACQSTQTHFLVRIARTRRLESEEVAQQYMTEQIRSWEAVNGRPFCVPASHGRTARMTVVQLAFGKVVILPPRGEKRYGPQPLPLWAIRVWEEQPPGGEEPLEWLLLTSVPTCSIEDAWEHVGWYECRWVVEEQPPGGEEPREWLLLTSVPTCSIEDAWEHVGWYECRWVVEDYRQCLKTGCRIEGRLMHTADRLIRLLGLLSPVAVRLLQLRDLSRQQPDRPACEIVPPDLLAVVAAQTGVSAASMTMATFWQAVARWEGIWLVVMMVRQAGKPCGLAGCGCKQ